MSKKLRHTTLIFTFIAILIVIIYVVTKFFTNDKYYAPIATIEEKALLSQKNEIIEFVISSKALSSYETTEQGELQCTSENERVETFNDEKTISTTSRSASEIKSSKPEIVQVKQTSTEEIKSYEQDESEEENFEEENTQTEDDSTKNIETSSNPDSIGTIYIPKTGINLPILKSVSVSGMETAVCYLYSTGSLNVSGTTLIVGHNYRNGKLFSNNKNLQIGDSIYVTTSNRNQVHYTIYEKFITDENDLSYLNKNTNGEAQIALSTCTDNDIDRLVILAK